MKVFKSPFQARQNLKFETFASATSNHAPSSLPLQSPLLASATTMDNYLDDAELWEAIESASASSRLRKGLLPPPQHRLPPPSPSPSHQFAYRNPCRPRPKLHPDEVGEVLQPEKKPRSAVQESIDRRIVVAQNQLGANITPKQGYPDPNPMAYQSPVKNRVLVSEVSPVVESPSPATEGKLGSRHSLLIGEFPSVATFKHFQDMALAVNLVLFC